MFERPGNRVVTVALTALPSLHGWGPQLHLIGFHTDTYRGIIKCRWNWKFPQKGARGPLAIEDHHCSNKLCCCYVPCLLMLLPWKNFKLCTLKSLLKPFLATNSFSPTCILPSCPHETCDPTCKHLIVDRSFPHYFTWGPVNFTWAQSLV